MMDCPQCQGPVEARSMQYCPECHGALCPDCATNSQGYCEMCAAGAQQAL